MVVMAEQHVVARMLVTFSWPPLKLVHGELFSWNATMGVGGGGAQKKHCDIMTRHGLFEYSYSVRFQRSKQPGYRYFGERAWKNLPDNDKHLKYVRYVKTASSRGNTKTKYLIKACMLNKSATCHFIWLSSELYVTSQHTYKFTLHCTYIYLALGNTWVCSNVNIECCQCTVYI